MSKLLPILTFPNPILAKRAKPIARIEKSYFELADRMLETMYDAPGVGLAANQVGVLQRILVIDVDYTFEDEQEQEKLESDGSKNIIHRNPRILLNPVITFKEGKTSFKEGCLSVPEFRSEVIRAERIKLSFQDLDGKSQTLLAEDFLAVAIQHEIDHLDGKLFIDRIPLIQKKIIKRKLLKSGDSK